MGAGTMRVTKVSSLTGVTHQKEIDVTKEQLIRHANGELIQDVCPDLSPEDREYLITGVTNEEWRQHISCPNCDE
jgi:hypothetical protein